MTTATRAPITTAPTVTEVPTIRFVSEEQIPPQRINKGRRKYASIVDRLAQRPMEWAVVAAGKTSSSGSGLAIYLRRNYGLEAMARSWDGEKYSVFARFVPIVGGAQDVG